MRKKIELRDTAMRREICEALHITNAALSYALNYRRNSPSAVAARAMALERGGVLMEEKPMSRTVRILNAKGETVRVIESKES